MGKGLNDTVESMINTLKDRAENQRVSSVEIGKLFEKQDINGLDDLFKDGGEARCEHFTDGAIDYALEFGKFESAPFMNAQWEATEEAMKQWKYQIK